MVITLQQRDFNYNLNIKRQEFCLFFFSSFSCVYVYAAELLHITEAAERLLHSDVKGACQTICHETGLHVMSAERGPGGRGGAGAPSLLR